MMHAIATEALLDISQNTGEWHFWRWHDGAGLDPSDTYSDTNQWCSRYFGAVEVSSSGDVVATL
jgi:hypothetical protein